VPFMNTTLPVSAGLQDSHPLLCGEGMACSDHSALRDDSGTSTRGLARRERRERDDSQDHQANLIVCRREPPKFTVISCNMWGQCLDREHSKFEVLQLVPSVVFQASLCW
jgi:hypothetical protein